MDFNVDDLVVLAPEYAGKHRQTVWKVRTRPRGSRGVNYTCDNHTTPGAQGLTAPGYMLRPAPADGAAPTVTHEPFVPLPMVGAVVTATDPRPKPKIHPDELFVVTKLADRADISRLGGHPGHRFWRVPPAWLTVVPLTEVADKIAPHLAAVAAAA